MAHKRLRDKGAELVLRSPTPPVRRVLQMAGLDKILVVE
jgi:anti-anti-sigma regulatory factor